MCLHHVPFKAIENNLVHLKDMGLSECSAFVLSYFVKHSKGEGVCYEKKVRVLTGVYAETQIYVYIDECL